MLIQTAGVHTVHLTDEEIEEYRTIARKLSGKELTRQQAYEDANKLIRFIQLIYSPDEYIDTRKKSEIEEKEQKDK